MCATAASLGRLDTHGHMEDGVHMPEAVLTTPKPVEASQDLLNPLVVALGIRGHDGYRRHHLPAIQLPVEKFPRLQIADNLDSQGRAGAHLAFQAHVQAPAGRSEYHVIASAQVSSTGPGHHVQALPCTRRR